MGSFRDYLRQREREDRGTRLRDRDHEVETEDDGDELDSLEDEEITVRKTPPKHILNAPAHPLLHNMSCAGLAASFRQAAIFFKRLIIRDY